jgi:hypothetical protein
VSSLGGPIERGSWHGCRGLARLGGSLSEKAAKECEPAFHCETTRKLRGRTNMTLMTMVIAIMLFYAAFYFWMRREAKRAIVEDENHESAMLNHCGRRLR